MTDAIYIRERNLHLYKPIEVAVFGCGGTGSWTALNLALLGIKKIYLFDDDDILMHNLNRTPYKLSDVGRKKVDALKDLILERRDIEVLSIPQKINEINTAILNPPCIVFDCLDNLESSNLAWKICKLRSLVYIRIGIDGDEISLYTSERKVWKLTSENQGYTMPSWLVPPLFASCIAIYKMATDLRGTKEIYCKPIKRVIRFDAKRKKKREGD